MREPGRVSVVVPSRNERFLPQTVADLLAKAAGDVEIYVVLDGYWPEPPLPDDRRLHLLHRGRALGMRPAINGALRLATGEWCMKLDAHCMVDEHWDAKLKADCDRDWLVVPRRYRLDPEGWCFKDVGKPPVDAHYLSFPFERPDDPSCGLHGTIWPDRARRRLDVPVDEEMSSQGSCWFCHRDQWERMGEMDVASYGSFIQEFQEIGLKTWLGGGRVMVNKRTWYAHLHKGVQYGRGYVVSKAEQRRGADFATRYWMTDGWAHRAHDLRWLIERFWPVPTWPADLGAAFAHAREVLAA